MVWFAKSMIWYRNLPIYQPNTIQYENYHLASLSDTKLTSIKCHLNCKLLKFNGCNLKFTIEVSLLVIELIGSITYLFCLHIHIFIINKLKDSFLNGIPYLIRYRFNFSWKNYLFWPINISKIFCFLSKSPKFSTNFKESQKKCRISWFCQHLVIKYELLSDVGKTSCTMKLISKSIKSRRRNCNYKSYWKCSKSCNLIYSTWFFFHYSVHSLRC